MTLFLKHHQFFEKFGFSLTKLEPEKRTSPMNLLALLYICISRIEELKLCGLICYSAVSLLQAAKDYFKKLGGFINSTIILNTPDRK
jgi:hypothetical protein